MFCERKSILETIFLDLLLHFDISTIEVTQYLLYLILKLPANLKLNPFPSMCLCMLLYSIMNDLFYWFHQQIPKSQQRHNCFSLMLWIKISVSTFLPSLSYLKATATIDFIFHEDLLLFNFTIMSTKFVFPQNIVLPKLH